MRGGSCGMNKGFTATVHVLLRDLYLHTAPGNESSP